MKDPFHEAREALNVAKRESGTHYQLLLPCPEGRGVAHLTNLESQEDNHLRLG